jgi:hypothetical protein
MNKSLVSIAIMISLIGCVSALDGSGVGMQPGETMGDGTVSQYSQYYTMPTGPATGMHIIAPQKYQISGNVPSTVYFSNQQQAMSFDQYQSSTTYLGGNSLWIQGSASWTQYAQVPQGALLSIIATTSTGGNGYLNEIYPDGRLFKNNYYYFPGHNRIGFYTDTVGQHILLFVIDGKVSNAIVIDVVSYQPPVYQPPVYLQPSYVSPIYYREIYEPKPTIHVYPWRHRENVSPTENGHDPHPHRGNVSPNEHWLN